MKWKNIKNWEKYSVSNTGLVKNNKWNKLLKPQKTKSGYLIIHFSNGKSIDKWFSIHRLVAQAFIPNPNNLPQVNHKDGNKINNCVENLEGCDSKYNNNYGNHTRKCTVDGIIFNSISECAKYLGTLQSVVSHCIDKENRRVKGKYVKSGKAI